jgi:DNA replication protein DnaC
MVDSIKKSLQSIRLRGMSDNLQFRLDQASNQNMSCIDFLSCLIEDELARRNRKSYEKRLLASSLQAHKTLENYDFSLQPTINKELIDRLATCDFIESKDKIIFMGISGIGKSHILNGIAIRALEKGYTVYQYNSHDLVDAIFEHKKENTYKQFLKKVLAADFFLLDEFVIRPYPEGGIDEIFALVEKLDETMSIGITSNRDFRDWQSYFSDNTIASAFTDRVINNAVLIKVEQGMSQRQKNFENKNRPKDTDPESDD